MREFLAKEFIIDEEIKASMEEGLKRAKNKDYVRSILEKAKSCQGLTHKEAAVLLNVEDTNVLEEMFRTAKEIKERIYGKRIVLFAPLYISSYCINGCLYCGYQACNETQKRSKLTMEQLEAEVKILESLGHKRIVIEAGEDPVNCSLDYVIECITKIYSLKFDNGSIRRININVAATTVEDYRRLKDADIGTYTLFQETYNQEVYERMHPTGPKHNYNWHTTAMDRAMEAGIGDVGIGVLYGLYDHKYETIAMLMHAEHLEEAFGVGPHTISVPRLRAAEGVDLKDLPYLVEDSDFKKIVAVLRLAVPYTGMILSTREEPNFRAEVLALGISQFSAGSCAGVGGYSEEHGINKTDEKPQFEVADHRSPMEVIKSLCETGYVPSYCTACYREGRTGDRFMALAKVGQIGNVCQPNALLTFREFLIDYADDELKEIGEKVIEKGLQDIPKEATRKAAIEKLKRIEAGERDLRF
ncbi:[FeFe] hydrogenase H-cluster radical SAM maturase HydG [Desulfosporosinus fructosivorans]|uniref:[FeFe] hydrogenase H-cluster radical SAM maturase HydG n=1 Tax=Desulfosporosinus fructosivorans TaxID=2018669 RepID=A0A4Z0R778_9FIRM|nr:[FeFe] hydrogenase H-cluster radical SAM maturase HydG [Desulfosporosinus fructosivorans]TGE38235.1 [FeFe] hydrogenase H-cluster radical SAM maturase HydG [Desulfosporosinus fructosivorans]